MEALEEDRAVWALGCREGWCQGQGWGNSRLTNSSCDLEISMDHLVSGLREEESRSCHSREDDWRSIVYLQRLCRSKNPSPMLSRRKDSQ